MLVVFVLAFLTHLTRASLSSCFHSNTCFNSDNTVAYARCVAAGGEKISLPCCEHFCRFKYGATGCSRCEQTCASESSYCPSLVNGQHPHCEPNSCDTDAGTCKFGQTRTCSDDSQCPCVCSGAESTECTQHPEAPPPPCRGGLRCNYDYNGRRQSCMHDACIKAPGSSRGHSFWDASLPCETSADTPCVCEFTGHECEAGAAVSILADVPCDATCEFDTEDTCLAAACVREFVEQEFGVCEFTEDERCVTNADCSCVCSESHMPCKSPPVLCPAMRCTNETAGTECHFQRCKFALGQTNGACELCGSPCDDDADCPCVCNLDQHTRCVPDLTTTLFETTTPNTESTTTNTPQPTPESTLETTTAPPPTPESTFEPTTTAVPTSTPTPCTPTECPSSPLVFHVNNNCSLVVPEEFTDGFGFCSGINGSFGDCEAIYLRPTLDGGELRICNTAPVECNGGKCTCEPVCACSYLTNPEGGVKFTLPCSEIIESTTTNTPQPTPESTLETTTTAESTTNTPQPTPESTLESTTTSESTTTNTPQPTPESTLETTTFNPTPTNTLSPCFGSCMPRDGFNLTSEFCRELVPFAHSDNTGECNLSTQRCEALFFSDATLTYGLAPCDSESDSNCLYAEPCTCTSSCYCEYEQATRPPPPDSRKRQPEVTTVFSRCNETVGCCIYNTSPNTCAEQTTMLDCSLFGGSFFTGSCCPSHTVCDCPTTTTELPTTTSTVLPTTTPVDQTTTLFNTPCCSQIVSIGELQTVACSPFDNECPSGWEPNTESNLCDEMCNPIVACCEFADTGMTTPQLECIEDVTPTECASTPDSSPNLLYCNSTCQPVMACCFSEGECLITSTFLCQQVIGGTTPPAPNQCSEACEPIGCCIETEPTRCSEVTRGECFGEFHEEPCCPGHPECCPTQVPTPAPTSTPTELPTSAPTEAPCDDRICPPFIEDLQLTSGDRCSRDLPISGFCTGDGEGSCFVHVLTDGANSVTQVCNENVLCQDDMCECEPICGCAYGDLLLRCEDIQSTTSPTTTQTPSPTPSTTSVLTTTSPPTTTTTPAPTGTPCDFLAHPVTCGVRPGCKGGSRDNKECRTIDDCPDGDACVPLHNACKDSEPCEECPSQSMEDRLRSCHVCLLCTQEEIDLQASQPEHEFAFDCCPDGLGSIDGPIPPEDKCDQHPNAPSDCAREYNCVCRVDECEDEFDALEGCGLTEQQFCVDYDAPIVQPNALHSANIICSKEAGDCGNDFDYYVLNVTKHRKAIVYVTDPDAIVEFHELTCDGNAPVTFSPAESTIPGDEFTGYSFTVEELGLLLVRVTLPCEDDFVCEKYKLIFKTRPVDCPAGLCEQHTCLSSIDCGSDASCWGCSTDYGVCIERANCTDDLCMSAGEPQDTCIDAEDGVSCVICNGHNVCHLGSCKDGSCAQAEVEFDCNCRCPRVCWRDEQCPIEEGFARYCDTHNGQCIYRPLEPEAMALASLRAGRAQNLRGECMREAIDASERGYSAYAMDRFGSFDRSTGDRRPALCGGNIEWQKITIDVASVPTVLQAECCTATTSWHDECFHGSVTSAEESGHTWADRAWYMMHQSRLLGEQGRVADATEKACCASLIWSAIGKTCGRSVDAWSLADTTVETESIGPAAKWFEDGAGDRDTNDAGIFVSQSILRDSRGIVAVNTHTFPIARGGGYRSSLGLAFGYSAGANERNDASFCPDRERRLHSSVLDQSATMKQVAAISQAPQGSIVGVFRHVVSGHDNKLPEHILDAECIAVSGRGTPACMPSAFVGLYPDMTTTLPFIKPTLEEELESPVSFREPVVNTQSGTRYQPPRYASSASYIPSRRIEQFAARFVLYNKDCGVTILDKDASMLQTPMVVTIPAHAAQYWRSANEGVDLFAKQTSSERKCRSGPFSGVEQCSNDAVCAGGHCGLPPSKSGVPYPFAATYFECVALGIDCKTNSNERCCRPEVQQWYLYATRSEELLYVPLNK